MNTDKGRKIPDHLDKDLLPRQKDDIDKALLDMVE